MQFKQLVFSSVILMMIVLTGCNDRKVQFTNINKEKRGIHTLGFATPLISGYKLSYNPNGNAIVTIYLSAAGSNDTFVTRPFNNPAQLSAMLTLLNSDSTITFDKANNEFHYLHAKP